MTFSAKNKLILTGLTHEFRASDFAFSDLFGFRGRSDILMSNILKRLASFKVMLPVVRGMVPGQLVIQLTDKCNARCPQCSMRANENYRRFTLSIDKVKRIIDGAAAKGVKAISFTGGEPFLYFDEIVSLLKYARDAGITYTRTGTNGFMFAESDSVDYRSRITKIAESLTEAGIYTLWISLDSAVPALHEAMRGLPGVVEGIEKALPIFHKHSIYPSANLGINRNIAEPPLDGISSLEVYDAFRSAFEKYYRFVIDLGFTMVNACYPMSIQNSNHATLDAVYRATSGARLVQFSRLEKAAVFRALFDAIPQFRSKIRIFTPRISLYALIKQYLLGEEHCYPCRGGREFFFIDARDGNTYPCGYRGHENLGDFRELTRDKITIQETCRKCDWECFRDPSELLGPLLDFRTKPATVIKKIMNDRHGMKLWYNDLKYFSACDFFNGNIPPDYQRLSRF